MKGDDFVTEGVAGVPGPCPKDQTERLPVTGGSWCPECKTLYRTLDEVLLDDLDSLPEV